MYWQSLWFGVPQSIRRLAGLFLTMSKEITMAALNANNHAAAALKAERERDKIRAMRDYEAETLARQANMMRLRALRLAKESGDAQATMAQRSVKKKAAIRVVTLTQARCRLRKPS
jgi:hypothetical protein